MSCRGKANYSGAIFKKFCLQPRLSSRSAGNVISFEGLRLSLPQFYVKLRNTDGGFIVFELEGLEGLLSAELIVIMTPL